MADRGLQQPSRMLGILGGMGPAATADFYMRLVLATPAPADRAHLPVVIWADPRTPDRSDAILNNGEDPTPWLRHGARVLRESGADTIVVPCVTSHHFVREVAREMGLRLLDVVEATVDYIAARDLQRVGLLATTGTVKARLFQDALNRKGVTVLEPDTETQEQVMLAIRLVKSGRVESSRELFASAALSAQARGAEGIIAGCTEIPLGLRSEPLNAPLIDPVRITIDRIVREWFDISAIN